MALAEYTSRFDDPKELIRQPLSLTKGMVAILAALNRYRYSRSHFIAALVDRNLNSNIADQLLSLVRHGYIKKPHLMEQRVYIGRRANLVYELTQKGIRALREQGLYEFDLVAPLHPARDERSDRFPHSLMICDILAGIEIGVKAAGGRLVTQKEITDKPLETPAFRIAYKDIPVKTMAVEPDALFAVELDGQKSYYVLEADCDTESDRRSTFARTSYLRKIVQYKELLKQGVHKSHWGVPHLNILNVTITDLNMRQLMDLTEEVAGPSKSMLFASHPYLKQRQSPKADGSMFTRPYLRVGHPPYYMQKEKAAA